MTDEDEIKKDSNENDNMMLASDSKTSHSDSSEDIEDVSEVNWQLLYKLFLNT